MSELVPTDRVLTRLYRAIQIERTSQPMRPTREGPHRFGYAERFPRQKRFPISSFQTSFLLHIRRGIQPRFSRFGPSTGRDRLGLLRRRRGREWLRGWGRRSGARAAERRFSPQPCGGGEGTSSPLSTCGGEREPRRRQDIHRFFR